MKFIKIGDLRIRLDAIESYSYTTEFDVRSEADKKLITICTSAETNCEYLTWVSDALEFEDEITTKEAEEVIAKLDEIFL